MGFPPPSKNVQAGCSPLASQHRPHQARASSSRTRPSAIGMPIFVRRAPLPHELRLWHLLLLRNGPAGRRRGTSAPTLEKRSDHGGDRARMEADRNHSLEELTATTAVYGPGAEKEKACAARRDVSSGLACPAPRQDPRTAWGGLGGA